MAENKVSLDLQLQIAEFQKNLKAIENQVNGFSAEFQKNTKGNTQAFNTFVGSLASKGVEVAVSGLKNLVSGIGAVGVQAVQNAGQLEEFSTQLGVLLGSAEAGERQLRSLQQFAASSPFQLPGIVEANKLLLAFGTTAREVPEVLTVLGNIAAGSGKPLSDLARIFGQVQAETRLSLERLNQLNDAGVDLGSTLAQRLGIPLGQVRKAVTDGRVSFELFRQSLIQIQADGGVYANAMIKQSETLSGRLSTLKDNIFNLSGDFGKILFPAVKSTVDILISFVQTVQDNIDIVVDAGKALVITAGLIGAYTVATNAATIATTAFNLATKLTPWGLAIAGVAALSAGIFTLIRYWDDVRIAALRAVAGILEALKPIEPILKRFLKIDVQAITNSLNTVNAKIAEVKAGIEKPTAPIVEEAELTKGVTAAERAAAERVEIEKRANAERAAEARRISEELRLIEAEGAIQLQAIAAEQRELENVFIATRAEETIARREAELLATQEFERAKLDAVIQAELEKAAFIQDALTREQKIREINDKAQLDRAKLSSQQEVARARQTLENKRAIRQQDIADQQAFFSAATSLSNSENKKLALIGKTAALAELAIKTPQAIASSFAFGTKTGGPVLGGVFAAIAGAAMAAQAAKIAGLSFAQGGIVPGSSFTGDRVQANVNSGEAILNKRQQTELFRLANGGGGAGTDAMLERLDRLEQAILSQPIQVRVGDNEIALATFRGNQNGVPVFGV